MAVRRGGLALATLAIAGVYAVPLASAHLAHPSGAPAQAARAPFASPYAVALAGPLGAHWTVSPASSPSTS